MIRRKLLNQPCMNSKPVQTLFRAGIDDAMEQQPYSNQYAYNDWTAGYATAWQATAGVEATAQYAAGGTQEVSLDEQWRLYYAQQAAEAQPPPPTDPPPTDAPPGTTTATQHSDWESAAPPPPGVEPDNALPGHTSWHPAAADPNPPAPSATPPPAVEYTTSYPAPAVAYGYGYHQHPQNSYSQQPTYTYDQNGYPYPPRQDQYAPDWTHGYGYTQQGGYYGAAANPPAATGGGAGGDGSAMDYSQSYQAASHPWGSYPATHQGAEGGQYTSAQPAAEAGGGQRSYASAVAAPQAPAGTTAGAYGSGHDWGSANTQHWPALHTPAASQSQPPPPAPMAHSQQPLLPAPTPSLLPKPNWVPKSSLTHYQVSHSARQGSGGGAPKALRPAYTSVDKKEADKVADATLQPGAFPPDLRSYVERALARCTTDAQKEASQAIMKEFITRASMDGTLFTRNWDVEPLFPLDYNAKGEGEGGVLDSLLSKRKGKSRWEPVNGGMTSGRGGASNGVLATHEEKEAAIKKAQELAKLHTMRKQSASPSQDGKMSKRKNRRMLAALNGHLSDVEDGGDGKKGKGRIAIGVETEEERQRRQKRAKRFEANGDGGWDSEDELPTAFGQKGPKKKGGIRQRLQLAAHHWDGVGAGGGAAVEDLDWDELTIRGTCGVVEKKYLRLTSTPDPGSVRPEEVLAKALKMVVESARGYLFRCDQLKSIRQDLTVQRIENRFTAEVYETHARMALEAGDLGEYNQCLAQLKRLYREGVPGYTHEFAAYQLLYTVVQKGSKVELQHYIARLPKDTRADPAVQHALAVRQALALQNYCAFFRLYREAPNLNGLLMDLRVEQVRYEALQAMAKSIRPTVPITFVARTLGFAATNDAEEGPTDHIHECEEWLRAHGGVVVEGGTSEAAFDAKASVGMLVMPEPDVVVGHGDANLDLNDFFSRAPEGAAPS